MKTCSCEEPEQVGDEGGYQCWSCGLPPADDGRGFCPDCGERDERRGHQTCQYPS